MALPTYSLGDVTASSLPKVRRLIVFCKQCGSEVSDNAVVCTKCGMPTDNFDRKEEPAEISAGIVGVGYILAFAMPLIGGIIGIYVMAKGKPWHGIGILMLMVLSFYFWLGYFGANRNVRARKSFSTSHQSESHLSKSLREMRLRGAEIMP
jgi:hypothetical protein